VLNPYSSISYNIYIYVSLYISKGWLDLFPEYLGSPKYILGESYGGGRSMPFSFYYVFFFFFFFSSSSLSLSLCNSAYVRFSLFSCCSVNLKTKMYQKVTMFLHWPIKYWMNSQAGSRPCRALALETQALKTTGKMTEKK
jgi:hypothetical protein